MESSLGQSPLITNRSHGPIRAAREEDAKILSEMGWQYFSETFSPYNDPQDMLEVLTETFSPEIQAQEIANPYRRIFIYWEGPNPCAYVNLFDNPPPVYLQSQRPLQLHRLYVDSKFHGKGLAQELMKYCLQHAKEEGFDTLWLGVWEKNIRALKFYQKWGFEQVGDLNFQLGQDSQNDLILQRPIF